MELFLVNNIFFNLTQNFLNFFHAIFKLSHFRFLLLHSGMMTADGPPPHSHVRTQHVKAGENGFYYVFFVGRVQQQLKHPVVSILPCVAAVVGPFEHSLKNRVILHLKMYFLYEKCVNLHLFIFTVCCFMN